MSSIDSAKLVTLGVHFAMYIEWLISNLMIEALGKVQSIPAEELQSFADSSVGKALSTGAEVYAKSLLESGNDPINYSRFKQTLRTALLASSEGQLPFVESLRVGNPLSEAEFDQHAVLQYQSMMIYSSWFFPFALKHIAIASAAAVASSKSDALAIGRPVRSITIV